MEGGTCPLLHILQCLVKRDPFLHVSEIILRVSFWVEFSPARGSGMWERCIASSAQKSVQHWGTPWVNKADTPRKSEGVLVHQYHGDLRACLPALQEVVQNLIFFQYIRNGRQRGDDDN